MQRLGQVIGNMLAVMLLASTMPAHADASSGGRAFDHAVTGFPLTGGHAAAACETCHVGGVFKGTPKSCDGCHALGKRVVATPKPTSHIVTDAPCETCHFNTSTFLGARYNHGTAVPGQCVSCHNGRIATGRPANHSAGLMLTSSCDSCHRSYAFLPASWNHAGVAMGGHTCNQAGCHLAGGGNPNRYTAATAVSPVNHSSYLDTSTKSCDVCHISFSVWTVTMHEPQTGTCSSCHNGSAAEGKPAGHVATTDECSQCHISTTTWLGALGGKPSNHIPYNAGVTCSNCHTGASTALVNVGILHTFSSSYTCATCHITPNPYTGNNQLTRGTHEGSSGSNCTSNCHTQAASYSSWSCSGSGC